jgi:hypothetical protein
MITFNFANCVAAISSEQTQYAIARTHRANCSGVRPDRTRSTIYYHPRETLAAEDGV